MKKVLSVYEDKLNLHKSRNVRNSQKRKYNCGGYALGTFNWYVPSKEWRNDSFFMKSLDEKTKISVKEMLKDFNGRLRVIKSENEIKEGETCIAFRVSNNDFHFVKKSRNGQWWHKMGCCESIDIMYKEQVFSESWCYKYIGKIVLMALKE